MAARRVGWAYLLIFAVVVNLPPVWVVWGVSSIAIGGLVVGAVRAYLQASPETWARIHTWVISPLLAASLSTTVVLVFMLITALHAAPQQRSDPTQSLVGTMINELSRRITAIEDSRREERLESRVSVVESDIRIIKSDVHDLKFMLNTVFGAIVFQVLLPIVMGRLKQRTKNGNSNQ